MTGRPTDWTRVAAIFVAGLLGAAQFAKISLSLPQVATAFDAPVTRVAFLVSILGGIGILGGALAGRVVAAFGAGRVLIWSLVAGGILSIVQATLPPLPVFAALRVVEGVSHLGIVVAAPPLMAGLSSDADRPLVMAIWAAFFGVAFAIAALAVPPIVASGGLGALFAAHGVAMIAMAVILSVRMERQIRAPLSLDPVTVHARIYGDVNLFAPGAGFVFYTLIFVALVTLLPVAHGQPWLALVLPLLGLAGTFAAGPVLRRMAPERVATLGFASIAILAVPPFLGLWQGLLPLFLLMGMVPAASFAMIPHLNRSLADRAQATGCIAQLGNVGTTLGTPVFAACLAAGGIELLYLALAATAIGGLATVRATARAARPA